MPARFDAPTLLLVSLALAALAVAIAVARRLSIPRLAAALIVAGLVALVCGAGGLTWRRAGRGNVLVMVDLSGSTRGAAYRDRAELQRRVQSLLGETPRRFVYFAEKNQATVPDGPALHDLAGDRTVFSPPPDAERVLLFSDGRFELPAVAPPTFVILDPRLESVADAAVRSLAYRGQDVAIQTRVTNGAARPLALTGIPEAQPVNVTPGDLTVVRRATGAPVTARFAPGDAWPENDGLTIAPLPPAIAERWWVGAGAPAGWRSIDPAGLPVDAAAYLAPAVIVLNDIPAASLAPAASARLQQYARDLGGSVVLLGGSGAFAAGGYVGTGLDAMSPLASAPPRPVAEWFILIDGSGSMNDAAPADGSGLRRWDVATRAVGRLLPRLPPQDTVHVGSFAQAVRWWYPPQSAHDLATRPMPPEGVAPAGPTNLQAALADVGKAATGDGPKHLLLITDADATLTGAEQIGTDFAVRHLSASLLAIGDGAALPGLRQIAATTGGRVVSSNESTRWADALDELGRSATPDGVVHVPIDVRYVSALSLAARRIEPWDRTWLKGGADALAEGIAAGETVPLAARWRFGSGEVAALAFGPTPTEADRIVSLVARPPRDPRFAVRWDVAGRLRVALDAVDGARPMNSLAPTLELQSADGARADVHPVPQVGPGRYELTADAPRAPTFATLRAGSRVIDRIALAGRYAPEFDALGNDHDAMRELARRTGGRVLDPNFVAAVDFRWPRRDLPLAPWCGAAAAALLAAGLIYWKSLADRWP